MQGGRMLKGRMLPWTEAWNLILGRTSNPFGEGATRHPEAKRPVVRELVNVAFRNGPGTSTETREVWRTPLGPVIHRDSGKVYVLRAAADGARSAPHRDRGAAAIARRPGRDGG